MTTLIGNTTRLYSTPYLTVAEYKQAPTAIDYDNLVAASNDPAVQNAELANVIARASSWIDTHCNQVLSATLESEQQRTRMKSDGTIVVHPRYFPIVSLESFAYGTQPNQMVTFPDVSLGWIEDQSFVIPYSAGSINYSSQGPLQFGLPAIPRSPVYVQYNYVSGYANTTITASASAGATSITVKSGAGIMVGQSLTIYDGLNTEIVVVGSNYVHNSTTVPISALQFAHTSGISISSLPPAVKEAAILATTAFIKVRGDNSLVMGVVDTPSRPSSSKQNLDSDLAIAAELLKPFRRIR